MSKLTPLDRDRQRRTSSYKWMTFPWFQRIFRNEPQSYKNRLSFIVGSCLYPGTQFDRSRSDSVFNAIFQHIESDQQLEGKRLKTLEDQGPGNQGSNINRYPGIDHLLIVGDIIYADATADFCDPNSKYEQFKGSYRNALNGEERFAKRVFSNVPTYFANDDHEIENNWDGETEDLDDLKKLESAKQEAYRYLTLAATGWKDFKHIWHEFSSLDCPFFVFDTRLERDPKGRHGAQTMVSEEQFAGFKAWLHSARTKAAKTIFIVSGTPLAPVKRDFARFPKCLVNQDNLLAFPIFLGDILDALNKLKNTIEKELKEELEERKKSGIEENGIKKQLIAEKEIIWLTGDPHFSSANRIILKRHNSSESEQVAILNVCASGLYCPIPFVNDNMRSYDFVDPHDNREPVFNRKRKGVMSIDLDHGLSVHLEQHFITDDPQHFVRFDMDEDRIRISAFNAENESVGKSFTEPRLKRIVDQSIPKGTKKTT
ncbi:MAG: hypothetical protein GKR95_08530 [Gammaproteobacteria bacterium]|nr:hypothetical protein [Gammaproteobacteria bacterium]